MGFFSKLVSRIPIFFVGAGLIVATGSYRGNQVESGAEPLVGAGLFVVGVLLFAGLRVVS